MATHKLSESEIRIRVVPTRVRWPKTGTAAAWTSAHDCVDALQDLVRSLDVACLKAEHDREPPTGGIARRRAELCDQTLRKLANFRSFEIAQIALSENIVALESLRSRDPEQVQMLQKLTKALHDLREGIAATRRMVLERCKVREAVVVNSA